MDAGRLSQLGSTPPAGGPAARRGVSRRELVAGGAGGAALLGLAACGQARTDAAPRPALQAANLVLMVQQPTPPDIAVLNDLIRAYSSEFPTVKVELQQWLSQDLQAKLMAQIAGGVPPDVFEFNGSGVDVMSQKGIADLTPYLKGAYPFDINLYFKPLVEAFIRVPTEKSGWHMLPRYLNTFAMFYNIDLFQSKGVPLPKQGWTWDDYLSAAKKLTFEGPNGKIWGTALNWQQNFWLPFLWGNGAQVIAPDRVQYSGYLNSPAAVEALEFYTGLQTKQGVTPTVEELTSFPSARPPEKKQAPMFAAGRVAMVHYNASSMLQELTAAVAGGTAPIRWGVIHIPTKKGNVPPSLIVAPWRSLSGMSKAPDAAWTLLRQVAGVPGQTAFTKADLIVPTMPSVAKDTGLLNRPETAAILKTAEVSVPKEFFDPNQDKTIGANGGPTAAIQNVFLGKAAVKPALDKLVADADAAASTFKASK